MPVFSKTFEPDVPSTTPRATSGPVAVLSLMMSLVAALGVPSELVYQDTLKSAIVALGLLCAAALFFGQRRANSDKLHWHPMVLLPLVLLVYALGSMVWSHTYLAGVEAIRWFLVSLLLWLGINTFNRDTVPTLLWGIHAGAVSASLWAALQYWLNWSLFPQVAQPASTFANCNFFAEYAVCALPFSVGLLFNLRASRWLPALTLSLGLQIVSILMTGTRSALLALLALIPVFLVILWRYREQFAWSQWTRSTQLLVGTVLILGIAGAGSIAGVNTRFSVEGAPSNPWQTSILRAASVANSKEYTDGSTSIRTMMWMATARMMIANPLTGVGAGAWEVQIPLYQRSNLTFETDYYAHNEYLQLLSEYGALVGGLFWAFLLASLLLAAGKTWRLQGQTRDEAPLRSLALASLLALLIVSGAGFPLHLAGCGALLAISLALLAASDVRIGQSDTFTSSLFQWKPAYDRMAVFLLTGCIVLALYITQQAMQAETAIVRATKLAGKIVLAIQSQSDLPAGTKDELLRSIRRGIEINPHYRKLTSVTGDLLAAADDLPNAAWVWETVAASRPNIAAIWSNLALINSRLAQPGKALAALQQLKRLKPDALSTKSVEVTVLSNVGQYDVATHLLMQAFNRKDYDLNMVQTAYLLGLQTKNWPLAILALQTRNKDWPDQAADGYLRLGLLYADVGAQDAEKALAAFRAGLALVPPDQKKHYIAQIPQPYRSQM